MKKITTINLEYYYYFRIANLEKAKKEYNNCNSFVLNNSEIKKILFNNGKSSDFLYYQKLYRDFNTIINKLISGDGINNSKTFRKYISLLMIITNDTITLTQNLLFKNRRKLSKCPKFNFNGEHTKIENILKYNFNIPTLLNPDEFSSVLSRKFSIPILNILTIMFILLFIYYLYYTALHGFNDPVENFLFVLILFSNIYVFIVRGIIRKVSKLIEAENRAYSRIYNLVYHPFKIKKSLMEVLQFLKNLLNIKFNLSL